MANDFSSFSACKAYWRLEPAGITTDSISTNTLTVNNAANIISTTTPNQFREGSGGIYLERAASNFGSLSITDANLVSGFPFKSGDATEIITVTCWCKPFCWTNDTTYRYLWSKWNTTAARSIGFAVYSGAFNILVGYSSGGSSQALYTSSSYYAPNTWHFTAVSIDGINKKARLLIWREAGIQRWDRYEYAITNTVSVTTADFRIGESSTTGAPFFGYLDEVAVFNSLLSENTIERIRAGTFSGSSDTYVNDFSTLSNCNAFYRFEPGGLTTDSKSMNTLTASASSPTSSSAWWYYNEGTGSALFTRTSSQCFYITDANLPSGFPTKSGESNTTFTVCFWMRYSSATQYGGLVSKYLGTGNLRSWSILWGNTNQIILLWGTTNGTAVEQFNLGNSTVGANHWYHVSVAFDGPNKKILAVIHPQWGKYPTTIAEFSPTNTLSAVASELRIGSYDGGNYWNGYIDEVVIFDQFLSIADMDAVRSGTFTGSTLKKPVTFNNIFAQVAHNTVDNRTYKCLDPVRGNATYNLGLNFNYPQRCLSESSVSGGEKILVAKTPQTDLSGTVTATNNSTSLVFTVDPSSVISSGWILRVDNEAIPYMVSSVAGITVTLFRPYSGTTGSGKSCAYVSTTREVSNLWTNNAIDGSDAGRLTEVLGGVDTTNPSNVVGSTLIMLEYSSSAVGYVTSSNYVKFSRLGVTGAGTPFQMTGKYDTGEDLYIGQAQSTSGQFPGLLRNSTITRLVAENSNMLLFASATNSTFNDIVMHASSTNTDVFVGTYINCEFNRIRLLGSSGMRVVSVNASNQHWINCVFNDCLFGDPTAVSYIIRCYQNAYIPSYLDIIFRNCKCNYSSLLIYTASDNYAWTGRLRFEDYNQQSGVDFNLENFGTQLPSSGEASYGAQFSPDYRIFQSTSPSMMVNLPEKVSLQTPASQLFTIACSAGTTTTVNAFLRKNQYYGSNNLPEMVTKYSTGTAPNITRVVDITPMTDVDNTWDEVSNSFVTNANAAEVEFRFRSLNQNSRVWISDISVETGLEGSPPSHSGNDFSKTSSCVAWWKLDQSNILADSKGTNTLTNVGSVANDTTHFLQGDAAALFVTASNQYLRLASQSSNFPWQASTSARGTICGWVYSGAQSRMTALFGKADLSNQGTAVWIDDLLKLWVPWGSNSITFYYDTGITLASSHWYHIGLSVDGDGCYFRIRVYDATAATATNYENVPRYSLYRSTNEFRIGAYNGFSVGGLHATFNGTIDEVVVFNTFLEDYEIDAIRNFSY